MIHIKIDNVARYIQSETIEKNAIRQSIDINKYAPIIATPFDKAVFEYSSFGEHIIIAVGGNRLNKEEARKIKDSFKKEHRHPVNYDEEMFQIYDDGFYTGLGLYAGESHLGDMRCYADESGVMLASVVYVDDDFNEFKNTKTNVEGDLFAFVLLAVLPALAAISFMHCKNVALIDEPLSRQQRRMKERKGGIHYKVLDIEPFKKQVRSEMRPGESQLQRALHICRGNFATYTEDKPLFGKLTGTYWRPMHVKGNKSRGEIVKDYDIVINNP